MSELAVINTQTGEYIPSGQGAHEQADYWAAATNAAWRKTVEGVIETGRTIVEALEQMPHGSRMDYYDSLVFSQQTANKIASIARCDRLSDYAHGRNLPPSWRTLYELTTLTDSQWDAAEEAELIRADTERSEITKFKNAWKKQEKEQDIAGIVLDAPSVSGLIHGCCIDGMKTLPDSSVDLVVTDPPYNMDKADWDSFGSGEQFAAWCEEWLTEAVRVLKPTGSLYVFGINRMLSHLQQYLDRHMVYRNWIVWDTIQGAGGGLWTNRHEAILYYSKTKTTYEDKDAVKLERHEENIREYKGKTYQFKNPSNIWRFPAVDDKSKDRTHHITQKPVEMMQRIIRASCSGSGIVLDPFMGSGTTAVAAIREGRDWIGYEKDQSNHAIAADRISREIACE